MYIRVYEPTCSTLFPKQQSQIEGSSISFLKDRHVQFQIRNRWLGTLDPQTLDPQTLDPQTLDQAIPDPKSVARDSRPSDSDFRFQTWKNTNELCCAQLGLRTHQNGTTKKDQVCCTQIALNAHRKNAKEKIHNVVTNCVLENLQGCKQQDHLCCDQSGFWPHRKCTADVLWFSLWHRIVFVQRLAAIAYWFIL